MEELLKVVLQEGNKDCGICALLSIIRFYGGDVSREYLRELTGTTKTGVSFYQLLEAANQLGFSCEGVKENFLFWILRSYLVLLILFFKKNINILLLYIKLML